LGPEDLFHPREGGVFIVEVRGGKDGHNGLSRLARLL
jgi:hypothetical protein